MDTEIMELSDQEVRAFAMILADKCAAEARETIESVLAVTRKGA